MENILIIHIGAPKCASTSLQASLKKLSSETNNLNFKVLPCKPWHGQKNDNIILPDKLSFPEKNNKKLIKTLINKLVSAKKIINILSHESLYDSHFKTIKYILKVVSEMSYFKKIYCIGFVRKNSSFLISGFGQWGFRNFEKLKFTQEFISKKGLNHNLLTPLEMHLSKVVLSGRNYGINWNENKFINLINFANDLNLDFKVNFDMIPTSDRNYILLERFFELCDLKSIYNLEVLQKSSIKANLSYDASLIHSVSTYLIKYAFLKYLLPKPYEKGAVLNKTSAIISSREIFKNELSIAYKHHNELIEILSDYIDYLKYNSNYSFAAKFNIPNELFLPNNNHNLLSHEKIKIDLTCYLKKILDKRDHKQINNFNAKYWEIFANSFKKFIN